MGLGLMFVVVNSLFYWWRKPVVSSDPKDRLNSQYTHYCSLDVVFIQNVILVPMVIIVDHDVIHVSTGYVIDLTDSVYMVVLTDSQDMTVF
jgi:hypothetical protein